MTRSNLLGIARAVAFVLAIDLAIIAASSVMFGAVK